MRYYGKQARDVSLPETSPPAQHRVLLRTVPLVQEEGEQGNQRPVFSCHHMECVEPGNVMAFAKARVPSFRERHEIVHRRGP